MVALLSLSGLAAAEPLAIVTGDGGGQAEGQAHGDYHADANGALDEADDQQDDLQENASADARNANSATTQFKWKIYEQMTDMELPEQPNCECRELFEKLEQTGELELSHTDQVQKVTNVETEYADAGADVGASGQVSAFFTDALKGSEDLYDQVKGAIGFETDAREDAESAAEHTLETEGELRGELVQQTDQDVDLPDANPSVDGSTQAEHATEMTSSAAGDGEAEAP